MRTLLLPLLFVSTLAVRGQTPAPVETTMPPPVATMPVADVRTELEARHTTDQSLRSQFTEIEKKHGRDSTEYKAAMTKQRTIDEDNIRRLEEIIAQYGWPGRMQFGEKAARAAFLILQHSDLVYQKKYLPIAREAAAKNELPPSQLALLEDRVRLREGGKQIYGSQVNRNAAGEWEPLPLENEEKVDALRASVGLQPLWAYLQSFANRSGGKVSPKWAKKPEVAPAKAAEPADGTHGG